jgi:hypothetical protein
MGALLAIVCMEALVAAEPIARWKGSCPLAGKGYMNACVEAKPVVGKTCAANPMRIALRPRHAAKSAAALKQLELVTKDPATPDDLAAARFYLAEAELETLVKLGPPPTFSLKDDAHVKEAGKAWSRWFIAFSKEADNVAKLYSELREQASAGSVWRAAAIARHAQLLELYVNQLESMLLIDVDAEAVKAVCELVTDRTRPMREQARAAWARCLAANPMGEWAQTCEDGAKRNPR